MQPNKKLLEAKKSLDKLINKSRTQMYKPIQIAEILHYDRLNPDVIDLDSKETYRNLSKVWRDEVTMLLLGTKSTSSSQYQDNIFRDNAMLPEKISILGEVNRQYNGIVENYIYHRFRQRRSSIALAYDYLDTRTSSKIFVLSDFLELFKKTQGLRKSIDKVFEIVTYALFSTVVEELDVIVRSQNQK